MPDFGIFRGFNDKLFGNKLYAGQLPTQLGNITFSGLLDFYPNASAAYSLRKLRNAYTGSAIRVRRSSDNTEQDIGFDIDGNLNTSSLTIFCGAGNGFVTTWYDQSGNARNATQTTAANQPQIVSNGIIINLFDKPSLLFDGNNDFLEISYKPTTNIIAVESLQKFNSASGISLSISEPPQLYLQWVDNPNTFSNYYNGSSTTTAYSNNRLLHSFYMNNSGGGFYQNSTLTVSRLQGSSTASANNINIGRWNKGSLNANCNHQEFILWQSDQSSNRTGIESNINTYYAIY